MSNENVSCITGVERTNREKKKEQVLNLIKNLLYTEDHSLLTDYLITFSDQGVTSDGLAVWTPAS